MTDAIPGLPVFGWRSMQGPRHHALAPSLLDLPSVVFTISGRAAIYLALEALGVGPGDRVLVPTYHCPTMVAPIVARGATPLFYGIDASGAAMLERLDVPDLAGVRAVLFAHLFGIPQPMARLRRWCDDHRIALIEDCAHALFGRSDQRAVGAWGDLAIGSLTKFLPLPVGGCLVVNGGRRYPTLEAMRWRDEMKDLLDMIETGARHGRLMGFNRLVSDGLELARRARGGSVATRREDGLEPNLEAMCSFDTVAARRHLSRAARWVARTLPKASIVERRRRRYAELAQRFARVPGMRPLLPALPAESAPYVFPLWVDTPDPGYVGLKRRGMPVYRWNWRWPGTPTIEGDHGCDWSHHVLQLACHQDLTDAQVEALVSEIVATFGPGARAS